MRISGIPLSILAAFLTACGSHVANTPVASPEPGTRIRYAVTADTNRLLSGRFVSLDADSLVFERYLPGVREGKWVASEIPSDSMARLQVKVGRRANVGRGALVGLAVGATLGLICAGGDEGFGQPSGEDCLVGMTALGGGTGLLIGALVRSDVWAPIAPPRAATPPVVVGSGSLVPARLPMKIGLRLPLP